MPSRVELLGGWDGCRVQRSTGLWGDEFLLWRMGLVSHAELWHLEHTMEHQLSDAELSIESVPESPTEIALLLISVLYLNGLHQCTCSVYGFAGWSNHKQTRAWLQHIIDVKWNQVQQQLWKYLVRGSLRYENPHSIATGCYNRELFPKWRNSFNFWFVVLAIFFIISLYYLQSV
jgi:hypothetical protein